MLSEKFVITGMDQAILDKAKELIPISADEPRGLREGTMFFSYKGMWLVQHNEGTMLWECQSVNGKPIPKELEGKFTIRDRIIKLIDKHGDPQQMKEGEEILERKKIKLQQDIDRKAKDNTPQEWNRLPVRAYEDSQARRKDYENGKDKPTVME